MENRKSFLELKVVWKDNDMFELKVTASNGRFSGMTEVYDTTESLSSLARSLSNFPTVIKTLLHEAGEKDSYSYFSMMFYPVGRSGLIGVLINLEENVATEYRPEEKDKIKLEIIVELNSIDNFQKELLGIAINQKGTVVLNGHDT